MTVAARGQAEYAKLATPRDKRLGAGESPNAQLCPTAPCQCARRRRIRAGPSVVVVVLPALNDDDDDHGDGDDDLHLSSHEISDHQHDGYAAAEEDHPSPSDANVDDAYENYRFAIAPSTQDPQSETGQANQRNAQQKKQNQHRTRHHHPSQRPPEQQELTRIPLTQLNPADRIFDNTFSDSLRSLSESLSNLEHAEAASDEEELALRILEETAKAGRRAYGEDWDRDDDDDDGAYDNGDDDGCYGDAYNYGGPVVSRRQRRHRVMMGCCGIAACAVFLSVLLVGKGRSHHHPTTHKDPLGLRAEDENDGTSETDAWERACSAHSISSPGERHQCADACRIYDCCAADADAGEEGSCADQKEDDCERFWQLCPVVLDMPTESASTKSPQRPVSNWEQQQLLQACGEANTNTAKFDQCQELCANRLCCLEMYGGGCITLKEYQCHLYQEPCSILAVDLAQAIAKHVGEEHEDKVEGEGGKYLR